MTDIAELPAIDELAKIVATMLTVAITTTGRPFLTLFVLFTLPTFLIETTIWDPNDWYFGSVHRGVLGGLGILAFIEHFWRGSEVYQEMVEQLPWDRLPVLVTIWLMFVGGFANASDGTAAPLGLGAGSILLGGALVVHWGVAWARRRVLTLLRDLGLGGIYNWVEPMGVVGLIVMVILLPFLALGAAILAAGGVASMAAGAKVIERRIDQQHRRPCPHCGHQVRDEASRCPKCGGTVTVTRNLASLPLG